VRVTNGVVLVVVVLGKTTGLNVLVVVVRLVVVRVGRAVVVVTLVSHWIFKLDRSTQLPLSIQENRRRLVSGHEFGPMAVCIA
jgi:hypothetical protein